MVPITDTIDLPEVVLDFRVLDRLPTDDDLPCDDGEPLETYWHRPAINLLVESVDHHLSGRNDFFVGGNMFLYFSKRRVFNKDFRGPDFFFVRGVDRAKKRKSWIYWQEEKNPDVVIELSSESTVKTDRVEKKVVYGEQMRVPEYFIYDPQDGSLIGWRLINGGYGDPIDLDPHGRLWSEMLGMAIGIWDGVYLGNHERWLRFYDRQGNLIPTFHEDAEARATAETTARAAAEARATAETTARLAAEAEIEQLKRELDALRRPPSTP